ncbi:DNA recombination and repair protein RecO [hydrothermal vent metagenome]|uniref:DNA repair protein RecO n=1 Tax=hydrothermal vent metagenome TaxID=652676 RepID=A0A3B0WRU5_9ZZZZ
MEIEQSAFVLHSRPYRETSALVTFFSPDYGKFNGIIRGVRGGRKTASQKSALLQPFQLLTIQWRERANKSSDLVSIQQFERADVHFPLTGEASICGLYLNELLYRLLFTKIGVGVLFNDYQQTLYQLLAAHNRAEQAWSLRQFECHLLNELGQGIVCDTDLKEQPIKAKANYYFYPETGAINVEQDGLKTGIPIQGSSLLALAEQRYSEDALPDLKRLLRTVLTQYLGEKPIMTRQLFK